MACNPTVQYDDFTGDGQTTAYTITFPYDTSSKTDVMVRLGTYPNYTYPTYTTDYSVDAANPNVVNFVTAPSGLKTINNTKKQPKIKKRHSSLILKISGTTVKNAAPNNGP